MSGVQMDVHRVVGFLEQFDFKHVHIQSNDFEITVAAPRDAGAPGGEGPESSGAVPGRVAPDAGAEAEARSAIQPRIGIASGYRYLKSPLLGVFQGVRNAPAGHLLEGTTVERGALLGHVKARGASREVLAEQGGEIVRACVRDDDFVAYGKTLFVLRPTRSREA